MKHGTPSQANRGPKNPGRSWERAKFAKPRTGRSRTGQVRKSACARGCRLPAVLIAAALFPQTYGDGPTKKPRSKTSTVGRPTRPSILVSPTGGKIAAPVSPVGAGLNLCL